MAKVSSASEAAFPIGTPPLQEALAVAIYYFPAAAMQGDIDNIVKPMLDALCNRVYVDDKDVAMVVVRKIEPGQAVVTTNPTPMLVSTITGPKPMIYIRISDDPMSVTL